MKPNAFILEELGINPDDITGLDLSFCVDDDLPPDLLRQAGILVEPKAGGDRWDDLISCWLEDLADELPLRLQAKAYCLGLQLVSDAEIARLNAEWRHQEGPTDVLAFAAQDEPEETLFDLFDLELGDIVISLETAARQAEEHGHTLERELLFLASHGLLHTLGWDHPDADSLAAMLARQEALLQLVLPAD
ncbi:MAG: rRNA maturation RNase YbeY [Cyanobium sp.]